MEHEKPASSKNVYLYKLPVWVVISEVAKGQEKGIIQLLLSIKKCYKEHPTQREAIQEIIQKTLDGHYASCENLHTFSVRNRLVDDLRDAELTVMANKAVAGVYDHNFLLLVGQTYEKRYCQYRNSLKPTVDDDKSIPISETKEMPASDDTKVANGETNEDDEHKKKKKKNRKKNKEKKPNVTTDILFGTMTNDGTYKGSEPMPKLVSEKYATHEDYEYHNLLITIFLRLVRQFATQFLSMTSQKARDRRIGRGAMGCKFYSFYNAQQTSTVPMKYFSKSEAIEHFTKGSPEMTKDLVDRMMVYNIDTEFILIISIDEPGVLTHYYFDKYTVNLGRKT